MVDITPELAEICGIHAGDGYLRKRGNRYELEIGGSQEEKKYYDNHVIPLFEKVFGLNLVGKTYVKGTYGFTTSDKKIVETLNKLGFPYGKKSLNVRVPKEILNNKYQKIQTSFLRGLLDTDGHIGFHKRTGNYCKFKLTHHYYPVIRLVTISKYLAQDICFLLNNLRIKYFAYNYQPKDLRDKYKYTINISGTKRLFRWMKIIGSKNPVKFSRYQVWKKFGFCPTNLTLKQREDILKSELDISSI